MWLQHGNPMKETSVTSARARAGSPFDGHQLFVEDLLCLGPLHRALDGEGQIARRGEENMRLEHVRITRLHRIRCFHTWACKAA